MNIIFLDIDGVLNFTSMAYEDKISDSMGEVSKRAVHNLNSITNKTGAWIVVTSSWRKDTNQTHGTLAERLEKFGVTGKVLGYTPVLPSPCLRGNEINQWLKDNVKRYGCVHESEFSSYVILDDDDDMLLWQANNFIQVDHYAGLTINHAHRACRMLGVFK